MAELRILGHRDEEAVHRLLDMEPERDVYLRGLVWRHGTQLPDGLGSIHGWFVEGDLRGVFLHSTSIVLACKDPAGIVAFASYIAGHCQLHPFAELLSPRAMAEPFLLALRARIRLPSVRLLREEMPAMMADWDGLRTLHDSGVRGGAAPIRQATAADVASMLPICRAMTREELGFDPGEGDEVAYRQLVERRVRAGREWMWEEDGRVVFRAAVSAATPEAVLIEGVFTPPDQRGRGRATRGMHAVTERLLRWHQRVVLFVDHRNVAALRVYDRLGFRRFDAYQAVYFNTDSQPGTAAHPWARGSTPGLRIVP